MRDLTIESSKELSLILLGMKLGKSLSFDVEYETEESMMLGDFDGAGLTIHKGGRTSVESCCDIQNQVYYLAIQGAWAEAKEESETFYKGAANGDS